MLLRWISCFINELQTWVVKWEKFKKIVLSLSLSSSLYCYHDPRSLTLIGVMVALGIILDIYDSVFPERYIWIIWKHHEYVFDNLVDGCWKPWSESPLTARRGPVVLRPSVQRYYRSERNIYCTIKLWDYGPTPNYLRNWNKVSSSLSFDSVHMNKG
jgi:hypothetical protein